MKFEYNSSIYISHCFYIYCPNCNAIIDMVERGHWFTDKFMCDTCLKYYDFKIQFEVKKHEED